MPTYGEILRLRSLSVPTLASAIETFDVVAPNEGYTTRPLQVHQRRRRTVIANAVTVSATTDRAPGTAPPAVDEHRYWRFVDAVEGPTKLVVLQDLDEPPGGSVWGERDAGLHQAFDCVGTVTEGAVRDLDALERLGFDAFATAVSVGRGYGRIVGYGEPVTVAGLTVATGDLLAADRHGVLRIPDIPLAELLDVANEIARLEFEVFARSQSQHFNVEGVDELTQWVADRWPQPRTG